MSISDADLLRCFVGLYEGDKDPPKLKFYSNKVVTTSKEHPCPSVWDSKNQYQIPAGSRAVREHALVDGKWGSSWTCEACIVEWGHKTGVLEEAEKCG